MLIITCPCALALAVPAVQVIATSALFRAGMLLKSATALERLAEVDTVVFDKTGTLTEPTLALLQDGVDEEALREAASLAADSRHPLARSLVAAAGPVAAADGVVSPAEACGGRLRLGSPDFCGSPPPPPPPARGGGVGHAPPPAGRGGGRGRSYGSPGPDTAVRFVFQRDPARRRRRNCARLGIGLESICLSGDRTALGRARCRRARHRRLARGMFAGAEGGRGRGAGGRGRHVLMVGDGLNDGPSLAAATVSASPATAADISQTVADVVFQGRMLGPVATVIETARRARAVMRQNLGLSIGYNA